MSRIFGGVIAVTLGAFVGAWIGFALVFYGYLLFHPPGPSRVAFEFASTRAIIFGAPIGMLVGILIGYRVTRSKWGIPR